jgi:hypothetical protein
MLTISPIASSFGRLGRTAAIGSRTKIVAEQREKSMATAGGWHEIVLQTLKQNEIRLVPYVPDRVLTTLISNIHADPFFTTFPTAREEEAVGIVSGAWMAGMRGTRHARRIQLRPVAGLPHHAPGARLACDGTPHHHPARRA